VFAGMLYFAHAELNASDLSHAPAMMAVLAALIVTATVGATVDCLALLKQNHLSWRLGSLPSPLVFAWHMRWTGSMLDAIGGAILIATLAA
jgi:hypothetical protein